MSPILIAISVWLHAMATVVFIGYYVLLALIYLPALEDGLQESRGATITRISSHSRVWLYVSLGIFAISGAYLTLVDPDYLGLGNFSNPWTILMLAKHIVILTMVGMGFWFNAILHVGPLATSNTGAQQAIVRFHSYVNWMAGCGVAVLLLTAMAQARY
jgi:uncharacterized membrane protein